MKKLLQQKIIEMLSQENVKIAEGQNICLLRKQYKIYYNGNLLC